MMSEFEERYKETQLHHISKERAEDLYRKYMAFEKHYGDKRMPSLRREGLNMRTNSRRIIQLISTS